MAEEMLIEEDPNSDGPGCGTSLAAFGSMVTVVFSLVIAWLAARHGRYAAAGVCLLAAALACGLGTLASSVVDAKRLLAALSGPPSAGT